MTTKQEILDYLDSVLHPIVSPDNWNVYAELYDMIEDLPSAEPKTGKWERWVSNEDQTNSLWRCTSCGIVIADRKCLLWKYCPKCGARMDKE